ncbi:acyl-CoA dehydrogenase [Emcibacter sp.]|uniref:acyl-CoA dehydrogenase family protein n=1 Tax=Emcibacter sp. TaxID=1979954 RepID=UPI002AA6F514|nr:acyl-CoA dehydrogenase [Emcibacter sp.]
MNFDLTEEQTLLRNLIEKYVSDRYDPVKRLNYVRQQNGFDPEGWQLLAEMGVLAFPFAEALGGFGGGQVELITVAEALGRGVTTEPVLPVVLLAGCLLEKAGTVSQKEQWLEKIISGKGFVALAHSEKQARFNPDLVETQCVTKSGRTILNGKKQLVLGGPFADAFIVSAMDKNSDLGLYLVPANADGLVRRNYRLTDGSLASDLELIDVTSEPMAGGIRELKETISGAKLFICAELIGLMELMFEATLDYVKTRQQFGQPIGRFQVIQHRMADNYKRLELSRSQLYRVVTKDMENSSWQVALTGTKSFISENAVKLGEEAIQLHGGIGTTEELMVGQAFKKTLLFASLFGDSDFELHRYIQLAATV